MYVLPWVYSLPKQSTYEHRENAGRLKHDVLARQHVGVAQDMGLNVFSTCLTKSSPFFMLIVLFIFQFFYKVGLAVWRIKWH